MSEKACGGAAFPRFVPEGHYNGSVDEQGMSLRDYFAGQALAGYFAAPNTYHRSATDCASYMYEMADAMLAARVCLKTFDCNAGDHSDACPAC
jgi:hypothetical protein